MTWSGRLSIASLLNFPLPALIYADRMPLAENGRAPLCHPSCGAISVLHPGDRKRLFVAPATSLASRDSQTSLRTHKQIGILIQRLLKRSRNGNAANYVDARCHYSARCRSVDFVGKINISDASAGIVQRAKDHHVSESDVIILQEDPCRVRCANHAITLDCWLAGSLRRARNQIRINFV